MSPHTHALFVSSPIITLPLAVLCPDAVTWVQMLGALVYFANAQRLPELDDAKAAETGAFLVTHVMGPRLVRSLWEDLVR
ncbi:hypothetical protein B0H11DRAFT_2257617 [Mycena galericulata]|nr:hypothetical protein B0H11DRAFT_2257617 [Mycena galericulata]